MSNPRLCKRTLTPLCAACCVIFQIFHGMSHHSSRHLKQQGGTVKVNLMSRKSVCYQSLSCGLRAESLPAVLGHRRRGHTEGQSAVCESVCVRAWARLLFASFLWMLPVSPFSSPDVDEIVHQSPPGCYAGLGVPSSSNSPTTGVTAGGPVPRPTVLS